MLRQPSAFISCEANVQQIADDLAVAHNRDQRSRALLVQGEITFADVVHRDRDNVNTALAALVYYDYLSSDADTLRHFFVIVQHLDGNVGLQRSALEAFSSSMRTTEVENYVRLLTDRICINVGVAQRFGTHSLSNYRADTLNGTTELIGN